MPSVLLSRTRTKTFRIFGFEMSFVRRPRHMRCYYPRKIADHWRRNDELFTERNNSGGHRDDFCFAEMITGVALNGLNLRVRLNLDEIIANEFDFPEYLPNHLLIPFLRSPFPADFKMISRKLFREFYDICCIL